MTEYIQCRTLIFNHLRTKYRRMNNNNNIEYEDNNGSEKIILSKRIADYIFGREECAFVGQESELDLAEPEAIFASTSPEALNSCS